MANDWDLSAVVNSAAPVTFSENVDSENPLEFLNYLTFGEDDGLYSYSELEPPICTGVQDVDVSFCDPFLVPASSDDHDALQGAGNSILNPIVIPSDDLEVLSPENDSPFLLQQQEQPYHCTIHPKFSGIRGDFNSFSSESFQPQLGEAERPLLQPPQALEQREADSPVPIPRLPTKPAACPRSRSRRCNYNQKRTVEQVPAERLNSDVWSWRKYGQKPIKGSPFPRNYYRCSTTKGCTARKQVERSSSDPDMFIICYTGEHNHSRPAVNRHPGSRFRYLGRPHFHIPFFKTYEVAPIAAAAPPPLIPAMGCTAYLPPPLRPSLYSPTTPPLTFKDYILNGGVGAGNESHVGSSSDGGSGGLVPNLDEAKI